ncbi:MAG: glycosyltransferase family 4 protein [Pyramidobacter sp.]
MATTKAIDYVTWKNEYKKDEEEINGVHVKRFAVRQNRDLKVFDPLTRDFNERVLNRPETEKQWITAQGPDCPSLIQWLRDNKDAFDLFIFFTYLYYPTVLGLPEVKEKAVFVPTAHDEPYIRMGIMKPLFQQSQGIIYLTQDEKRLVNGIFNNDGVPSLVGGCGIDMPAASDRDYMKKQKVPSYIVYVGRIDGAKGCDVLFRYFKEYRRRSGTDLDLVLVGKEILKVPALPYIHKLGFVSDEVKNSVIAGARALVLPSQHESLSMVVLEAMAAEVPVIVNARCQVTKDHCIQSNAGLYYENYFEFEGILNRLLSDSELCRIMGQNGKRYVKDHYTWDVVVSDMVAFLNKRIEQAEKLRHCSSAGSAGI